MLEYFRKLGRSSSSFRDLGCSSRIILGSTREYFYGVWEIEALFSGSKEPVAPLGRPFNLKYCSRRNDLFKISILLHLKFRVNAA